MPRLFEHSLPRRFIYFLIVFFVVLLGLASRKFAGYLPVFVAKNAGDALWAAMVYFGVRGIFPYKKPVFAFTAALSFSFLIEFSQLYQAPWINKIRHTLLGALILGQGFLAVDLVRYACGILIACSLDTWWQKYTLPAKAALNNSR